ncbi:hypothetical protein HV299_27770 [Klebsiella grimontii]|uniref:hypothetical protein n=1 Tax=Klebsiella grimontii TaxID=2058152 RepID=UPI0012B86CF1|nr:hypothetical protein [Klebsiella grimontii]MBZ7127042.1 hypothetical protein [Klebsiella grimontii]MBZ7339121.1 hypothetical protein [Klebsiella grimontii]MDR4266113.1 hypothetical protein [Klebsiella grimontii]MDU3814343.1 hypothetical protein [Klebsiella grimontii]QLT11917.1 hypothetical protein HV299_27770 [Klebsiella grimontii]
MKTLPIIFLLTTFSAAALASEQDSAQACLSRGISKMAQDPGSDRLKHLVITDINTERYDEKIGSQHIATQLTATLEKEGNPVGKMLCLLENDRPLYVYFSDNR